MAIQSMASPMSASPFVMLARMEMAVVEGWTLAALSSFKQMSRLCVLPGLSEPCAAQRRWHDEPPQGVDLIGNYGHRSHDVDAERDI